MSFLYELYQLLMAFAKALTGLVGNTIAGSITDVSNALDGILIYWGAEVGAYGFWVPLLLVAGLGSTAAISYAVMDLTDGARTALGD
jgi:hypothetical protein